MALLAVLFDSSTGQYKSQKLGSAQISSQAITSALIAANAIATPHIANQGILSASFGANIIATPHILAGGIASACYASGSINGVHIANASILSSDIGSGAIGDGHIYPASIISSKIASGIVGLIHLQPWVSGKVIVGQGTTTTPITVDRQAGIEFVIDGFGSSIQTGTKGFMEIPFPGTLNSVRLLGDQSGQVNVHIWKTTYASYPPTSGNTICSSFPPSISGSFKYQNTFLSGWNKIIASGDILAFAVAPNASNIQICTVSLGVYK